MQDYELININKAYPFMFVLVLSNATLIFLCLPFPQIMDVMIPLCIKPFTTLLAGLLPPLPVTNGVSGRYDGTMQLVTLVTQSSTF
jgi:hypothetical protein